MTRRCVMVAWALALLAPSAAALEGTVVDAATRLPITDAIVTTPSAVVRTDAGGRFAVPEATSPAVRAVGYRRREAANMPATTIALEPIRPKAVYLSFYGIGSSVLREAVLALTTTTELNALVIDVKGDRGMFTHRSAAPAALGVPRQSVTTVADMPALVRTLKQRGLYLIARIVVFKDDPLAEARPDLAIRDTRGESWRDRENLRWTDPFRKEVQDYNLAVAEEAAALGFDEIQFDYVRFPDSNGLVYSQPVSQESRTAAIDGFLDAARRRLAPYNVFIAADIFGYVLWNTNDTMIGQQLEHLAQRLDYLSPMLYPSGFSFGIPGVRDPVAAPYDIVYHSLRRALQRTSLPGLRYRPWLQAFRDYAFDRREFTAKEIRAQITAAEAHGTSGWLLWNPQNRYDAAALLPRRGLPTE